MSCSRHRTPAGLAVLVIAALGAGCGGGDSTSSPATDSTTPADEGALTFTRGDGTSFSFDEVNVTCGETSTETKKPAIRVESMTNPADGEPAFFLEAVLADVRENPVVRLPSSYIESDPQGALLFAVDPETGNELNTSFEKSRGTIRFDSVSCDPSPRISFTIEGRIDTELEGLGVNEVEGSFTDAGG